MVTLVAYTFHALHTLYVSCFKPFKITFKKERNNAMFKNNHYELDKCTLASWVDENLDQSLSKTNIKTRFRVIRIWPWNPKAMDHKTKLSEVYTTTPTNISNEDS
jgi:hypothetical protein